MNDASTTAATSGGVKRLPIAASASDSIDRSTIAEGSFNGNDDDTAGASASREGRRIRRCAIPAVRRNRTAGADRYGSPGENRKSPAASSALIGEPAWRTGGCRPGTPTARIEAWLDD